VINNYAYEQCFWTSQIVDDVTFIKNFIVGHPMRLSMFNSFNLLMLFFVTPTIFASTIVMLTRFRSLKKMALKDDYWLYESLSCKVDKYTICEETLLNDSG